MLNEEIKNFIEEHRGTRPEDLALMAGKRPELPMAFIAQQVKGRRRVERKLPSWSENRDVVFPKSLPLEQCSSERVARYRSSLVGPGENAMDLTGGFGVDARFLMERFQRYLFFERDAELAAIAQWNFKVFGLDSRVEVVASDGVEALRAAEGVFDLIYLDPARRDGKSQKVSAFEDCEPNILGLWELLLNKSRRTLVKTSPGVDLSHSLAQLSQVKDVYVISVENECKEVLFAAESGFEGDPRIHCVNLLKNGGMDEFVFTLEEERALEAEVGIPTQYLYEPNASIMKAGAFKSVSARLRVKALNPRTRLYCSNDLIGDFPGRVFEIVGRGTLGPKDAKRLFPTRQANVISRNSGMSADELRKKLKLKDGGDRFAIGAAVSDVGRQLFACRLIPAD